MSPIGATHTHTPLAMSEVRRALRHQESLALVREVHSLEALFARSEPHVIKLFQKFADMMRACGPVTVIAQKTRVVFQVRVRYGGCYPRKSHLLWGLALPRVDPDPRFFKIEKYAPHFIATRSVYTPRLISIETFNDGCAKRTRSASRSI